MESALPAAPTETITDTSMPRVAEAAVASSSSTAPSTTPSANPPVAPQQSKVVQSAAESAAVKEKRREKEISKEISKQLTKLRKTAGLPESLAPAAVNVGVAQSSVGAILLREHERVLRDHIKLRDELTSTLSSLNTVYERVAQFENLTSKLRDESTRLSNIVQHQAKMIESLENYKEKLEAVLDSKTMRENELKELIAAESNHHQAQIGLMKKQLTHTSDAKDLEIKIAETKAEQSATLLQQAVLRIDQLEQQLSERASQQEEFQRILELSQQTMNKQSETIVAAQKAMQIEAKKLAEEKNKTARMMENFTLAIQIKQRNEQLEALCKQLLTEVADLKAAKSAALV